MLVADKGIVSATASSTMVLASKAKTPRSPNSLRTRLIRLGSVTQTLDEGKVEEISGRQILGITAPCFGINIEVL